MKKFKLFALALAIGTGSLFAASVVGSDDPELDEEYEYQELFDEAYGDADFYKKLEQENMAHQKQVDHGLELFETLLNENYTAYLNDDSLFLDNRINDEDPYQSMKVCTDTKVVKNKICSGTLKIAKR